MDTIDIRPGTALYPLNEHGAPKFGQSMTVVDGEENVIIVDTQFQGCSVLFDVVRMPDGEEYAIFPDAR